MRRSAISGRYHVYVDEPFAATLQHRYVDAVYHVSRLAFGPCRSEYGLGHRRAVVGAAGYLFFHGSKQPSTPTPCGARSRPLLRCGRTKRRLCADIGPVRHGACCRTRSAAVATYAENHGDDLVFAGDIERWLKDEDSPSTDIIIGGPPCQGFSALGKQDVLDHRNQLWLRYADTIRQARPQYFIWRMFRPFLSRTSSNGSNVSVSQWSPGRLHIRGADSQRRRFRRASATEAGHPHRSSPRPAASRAFQIRL